MASPPLSFLTQWDFVGSLDSNYHGVTILDSASTNIVTSDAMVSIAPTNKFDNRVLRPVSVLKEDPFENLDTITIQLGNGAVGGTGGDDAVPVLEVVERWY